MAARRSRGAHRRQGVGASAQTIHEALGKLDARSRRRHAALNKRLDDVDAILTNVAEALALIFTTLQAQLGEQAGSSDDGIEGVGGKGGRS